MGKTTRVIKHCLLNKKVICMSALSKMALLGALCFSSKPRDIILETLHGTHTTVQQRKLGQK